MKMRNRFSGHSALNDILRADWIKAIELSPDRFDGLLYKPRKNDHEEKQKTSNYEADVFGELDSNQEDLEYETPINVAILDCPDESESFLTMNDDDQNLGESSDPLILRIAHTPIPVGSIIEWQEEVAPNELRRVWWYVHSAIGYGTANVGSLYICIPARNFEDINGTVIDEKVYQANAFVAAALATRISIELVANAQHDTKTTQFGFETL